MQPHDTTQTPPRVKDLTGQRFGRLTVLSFSHVNKLRLAVWDCLCDCGNHSQVDGCSLRSGNTKSCGCLGFENRIAATRKHGFTHHPLYRTYIAMLTRCYSPQHEAYANYGGRGITVCDRWRESFANFLEDMGERPEWHTLDRIDNDGSYSPDNCRWATSAEQMNNKRSNVTLTYDGQTLTVTQWANVLGVPRHLLYERIYNGWTAERTLLQPLEIHRRRKA